ncbi:sugar ABC transporter permease [Paenibacillus sp. GP183]|uniref:carbohydrate ABC transporter permease n=1 Tax=Paenibacillus sp. GP183 TaxID=1882751 RepID=UPI0008966113|nr:sugar ABC transporter permease [Paenibacillus sp. GP183]SEC61226.1 carbohydrate ABC transporter membrane protein 1, CUT1 family [Paenibacillus sp. GP183]
MKHQAELTMEGHSALKRKKRFFNSQRQESLLAYTLTAPSLLTIGLFALYPILSSVWLSLHEFKLNMPFLGKPFVGFQQYATLSTDVRFWASLWNTVYFTFFSVLLELILGFAIAILINRSFRGRGIVRAAVLVPWAIPTVVSALMWKFMFNDQLGVINDIFVKAGILNHYIAWLGSKETALWSIIVTDVWKTTPFMALLILAGLQVIPSDMYEAAKVDGANRFQQLVKITIPLVKPAVLVALLFRTLDAFRVFDVVFVMTGGGPANSTETLSMYAQTTLMRYLDFGKGSALSVITFLCVLLISFFYIKILGVNIDKRS